jgi:hypothetical protein
MIEVTSKPAWEGGIREFAPLLREADRQEIYAHSGRTPEEALRVSARMSDVSACFYADGEPLLIFGVVQASRGKPGLKPQGVPWMMGTDLISSPKVRRQFARESRKKVDELLRVRYSSLTNITDARNKVHHRWLSWCGFKYLRTVPVGAFATPFYEFIRIENNV